MFGLGLRSGQCRSASVSSKQRVGWRTAVTLAANSIEFLAKEMANPDSQWSLGTFGGIAEYRRDKDEPVTLTRSGNVFSAVTPRGGIRIEARPDLRLFASESTTRESWAHRVSLCLRESECAMNQRTVLTELG